MIALIAVIVCWSIFGALFRGLFADCSIGAFGIADGFEFVNPVFIYKYNNVNWFGAIIVSLVYSLICPIGTVCYWFYKLCTVGRKNQE